MLDIVLVVKSNIIIIMMNTDKKISFFIKKLQKLEQLTHLRPTLRTETY